MKIIVDILLLIGFAYLLASAISGEDDEM